MSPRNLPLPSGDLAALAARHPTPFHLYEEAGILDGSVRLQRALGVLPGYRQYYAVKAAPNPYLLKLLRATGQGVDCSSLAELELAERCGFRGDEIMFTSNDTTAREFVRARELDAVINLDDIAHIPYLAHHAGLPDTVCLRFNPGPLKKGNAIIGNPVEAKYGFTRPQLMDGYRQLADAGVARFGLHAMVASNELDHEYFLDTGRILFELAAAIKQETGVAVAFINIGGGIGIPYRPEDRPLDIDALGTGLRAQHDEILRPAGLGEVTVSSEFGRCVTGPHGWLVARVLHVKETYKSYVGLDASMADLMRPALYGSYHHITVAGKEAAAPVRTYDVTGSLCENNDKFAIDRPLPEISPGDLVVIHDTGAHGHAMGFNYNGKLRAAELLLRRDGSVVPIRRAETLDDLFATLDFAGLADFDVQGRTTT